MLLTVYIKHGECNEGGTKGGAAKDNHGGSVGRVLFIGPSYEHRNDGAAEVLDEEDHGIGSAQTLQRNNLRHAGPESGGCHRIADGERDHQRYCYR